MKRPSFKKKCILKVLYKLPCSISKYLFIYLLYLAFICLESNDNNDTIFIFFNLQIVWTPVSYVGIFVVLLQQGKADMIICSSTAQHNWFSLLYSSVPSPRESPQSIGQCLSKGKAIRLQRRWWNTHFGEFLHHRWERIM